MNVQTGAWPFGFLLILITKISINSVGVDGNSLESCGQAKTPSGRLFTDVCRQTICIPWDFTDCLYDPAFANASLLCTCQETPELVTGDVSIATRAECPCDEEASSVITNFAIDGMLKACVCLPSMERATKPDEVEEAEQQSPGFPPILDRLFQNLQAVRKDFAVAD